MFYRKKPVIVQAIQWDGSKECFEQIKKLNPDGNVVNQYATNELYITTLEGVMKANLNDFIVCGITGELYPVKPFIFKDTYEKAE